MSTPTTEYLLPVPGGHLFVEETGDGPPLVLLHGGALDRRMWSAQIRPLAAAGYRVAAADARGHGQSSLPTVPFRQCDDVAALVQALGAGPAVLIGLSMGGGAAVDTALEHPEAVRAVVTVGSGTNEPAFTDPFALDVLAAQQEAAGLGDMDAWIDAFLRFAAGPHRELDEVDPDVVRRLGEMARETLISHIRPEAVQPEHVPDSWDRLAEIAVPVLAVLGELDVSDHLMMGRRLAASVPDGREVLIAEAAHYPPMERPEAFNQMLLEFLESLA
ncbi:alpha/beta hydrolase [Brevibacterium daeguense]|uniref:Alpha/beta hydrolase n=1 Tax=Brevibacterium daeguense TaxID=909936 RepID=A0ABP8EHZ7_9MICO|nr:alpha/beta hydrolase [Brevibacterium daeguense]